MKLCVPCQRSDHRQCRLEVLAPGEAPADGLGLVVFDCECPECHPLTLELEEPAPR